MSTEIKLIIECCKTTKNTQQLTEYINKIEDWDSFISLAYSHGIFPLVYKSLKDFTHLIPENIFTYMKQNYMNIVKQNMLMTSELIKITKILEENNIEAISFKGPVLSQLAYGDVISRQYCDLDILVDEKYIDKICSLLKEKDYQFDEILLKKIFENKSIFHDITIYKENIVNIEFHWRLFSDEYKTDFNNLDLAKYITYLEISDIQLKIFKNELTLLYLSIHGVKHNWERVEWLVDIVKLIENSSLNWDEVFHIAKITKNEKILFTTLKLCTYILDLELNDLVKSKFDKKIENFAKSFENLFIERFSNTLLQEEGSKNISKIQYDLLETNNSKIAFIISLLKPTQLEYSLIKLPKYLNFVYYFIRPFNVIFRKIS